MSEICYICRDVVKDDDRDVMQCTTCTSCFLHLTCAKSECAHRLKFAGGKKQPVPCPIEHPMKWRDTGQRVMAAKQFLGLRWRLGVPLWRRVLAHIRQMFYFSGLFCGLLGGCIGFLVYAGLIYFTMFWCFQSLVHMSQPDLDAVLWVQNWIMLFLLAASTALAFIGALIAQVPLLKDIWFEPQWLNWDVVYDKG